MRKTKWISYTAIRCYHQSVVCDNSSTCDATTLPLEEKERCNNSENLTPKMWLREFEFENLTPKIWLRELDSENWTSKMWLREFDYENLTPKKWLREFDFEDWTPRIGLREFDSENLTSKIWLREFDSENLTSRIWLREFDSENLTPRISKWPQYLTTRCAQMYDKLTARSNFSCDVQRERPELWFSQTRSADPASS